MSKNIITISREFGSGGRFIGETLAKKIGFALYDKDIIIKTAEETGLTEEFIEKTGESAPKKSLLSYGFVARAQNGASLSDYMFRIQRKIILEAAEKGHCIIVGRCADYILKDRKDCLNIFICGDRQKKAERIMRLYHLDEAKALKLMKETDKKRSVHYEYYTEQRWGDARNYTLCMNSSEAGFEKCLSVIRTLAEM